MISIKRKQQIHESEIETEDGVVTIKATFETAGRTGSWKRTDYKQTARDKTIGATLDEDGKPSEYTREQFREFFVHSREIADIHGCLVAIDITIDGKTESHTEPTFEFYASLPNPLIEEWLGVAWSLNPQWSPDPNG